MAKDDAQKPNDYTIEDLEVTASGEMPEVQSDVAPAAMPKQASAPRKDGTPYFDVPEYNEEIDPTNTDAAVEQAKQVAQDQESDYFDESEPAPPVARETLSSAWGTQDEDEGTETLDDEGEAYVSPEQLKAQKKKRIAILCTVLSVVLVVLAVAAIIVFLNVSKRARLSAAYQSAREALRHYEIAIAENPNMPADGTEVPNNSLFVVCDDHGGVYRFYYQNGELGSKSNPDVRPSKWASNPDVYRVFTGSVATRDEELKKLLISVCGLSANGTAVLDYPDLPDGRLPYAAVLTHTDVNGKKTVFYIYTVPYYTGAVVIMLGSSAYHAHNFANGTCTVCGVADPNYHAIELSDSDLATPANANKAQAVSTVGTNVAQYISALSYDQRGDLATIQEEVTAILDQSGVTNVSQVTVTLVGTQYQLQFTFVDGNTYLYKDEFLNVDPTFCMHVDVDGDEYCDKCGVSLYTNGLQYSLMADDTYSVSGYTGKSKKVYIPGRYLDVPVTAIYSGVFNGKDITYITLPSSITYIEGGAFANCDTLSSIAIPAGVTEIGSNAFAGCSGLTSITVDKNNPVYHSTGNCIIETASNTLVAGCKTSVIPTDGSVASIGNSAFAACSGLTSITIPDSVTSIGDSAFYGCSGLTSITIPDSVTTIGDYAFWGCIGLTSIIIPDSVTTIGDRTFSGCSALAEIHYGGTMAQWQTIAKGESWDNGTPDYLVHCTDGVLTKDGQVYEEQPTECQYHVDSNGDDICDKCGQHMPTEGLQYETIYNGTYSVSGYKGTATEVYIPATVDGVAVTYISSSAFLHYDNVSNPNNNLVTRVHLPDSIVGISTSAFYGCANLVEINLPEGLTTLNVEAFAGCSSLSYIEIPGGVTTLGSQVFDSCGALERVVLRSGVATISDQAFAFCVALNYIEIPATVQTIGRKAFNYCTALATIYYGGTMAQWQAITKVAGWDDGTSDYVVCCADGCLAKDGTAHVTEGLQYTLLDGGTYSVSGYTGTDAAVYIPVTYQGKPVTAVGAYAFCNDGYTYTNNNEIEAVHIPEGVTTIGRFAFDGCSGLTTVTIPEGVTSIGNGAFYNCSGLTSITVAQGNTKYHSAGNCIIHTSSKTLVLGCKTSVIPTDGSVTSIGVYAFSFCSGLTSITIPDSVTSIGYAAFLGCSGLTSITLPDSVTTIENQAFDGCSGLTSITIPASVTYIVTGAFAGCSGLTSITIPASVDVIYASAFNGCSGLTSITIPEGVTSIGNYAFEGCSGLTDIYYDGTMAQWQAIAKVAGWDQDTPDYLVRCTDGTLTKDGQAYSEQTEATDTLYLDVLALSWWAEGGARTYVHIWYTDGTNNTWPGTEMTALYTGIFEATYYSSRTIQGVIFVRMAPNWGSQTEGMLDEWNRIELYDFTFDPANPAYRVTSYIEGTFEGEWVPLGTEGLAYTLLEGGTYSVSGYTGSDTKVYIPATYNGKAVTAIGEYSFNNNGIHTNNDGIVKVHIPKSVKSIGNYAFYGCSRLISITIPEGVTSIGECAFSHCSRLISITIPEGVTAIGDNAFWNCCRLVEVYNKSTLSITAGSSNNGYVSYYAKNVYKTQGGSKLSLGEDGYLRYTDGDTISLIAYRGLDTDLTIPNDITEIYQYAFSSCSGLTSITIPEGVTTIGYRAFCDCSGLTSITIPAGVATIGDGAFDNCSALAEIHYGGTMAQWQALSKGSYWNSSTPDYLVRCTDGTWTKDGQVYEEKVTCDAHIDADGDDICDNCGEHMPTDGLAFALLEGGTYSISGYTGTDTEVYIPATYNGKAVTEIGAYAFCNDGNIYTNNNEIVAVHIPDSVTTIGDWTFYNCRGLTSITIPGGVTDIGSYAFRGCSGLTSITIPAGVTSIGEGAFYGCSGLTSITIPAGVTSIGAAAFSSCSGLTSIIADENNPVYHSAGNCLIQTANKTLIFGCKTSEIPTDGSVTTIGDYTFSGCSRLTSITIPEGVTTIGNYAFSLCSGLTSITIPEGVTSIGDLAFYGCSGLTSITIPEGVTSIGDYAFEGCSGLTSITIPEGVTSIGNYAFYNCNGLTSITIPDGVTSIGNYAFENCSGLTSITIPEGVTSIGNYAFERCGELTEIHYGGTVAQWQAITKGEDWNFSTPDYTVRCTDGDVAKDGHQHSYISVVTAATCGTDGYTTHTCSACAYSYMDNYVPASGDHVPGGWIPPIAATCSTAGRRDFYRCDVCDAAVDIDGNALSDEDLVVPPSGEHTYVNDVCSLCGAHRPTAGLVYTLLGDDTYSISGYEGSDTIVYIPATYNGKAVTEIGDKAFYNNGNTYTNNNEIEAVHIPDSVTYIGDRAFCYCSGLTSVTIPDSVTSIGVGAFSYCSGLTSIIADENNPVYHSAGNCLIQTANKTLIFGCNASEIPTDGSVTTIGNYAFSLCSGLTSITISEGVTTIGAEAFFLCSGLTTVTFAEGSQLNYIGGSAFSDCSGLTSITIPDSVATIEAWAFSNCSGLTTITIPESVTYIGNNAFRGCSGLENIDFGGTVAQWQAITKGENWDHDTAEYNVHCLDGDVAKDGHQHNYNVTVVNPTCARPGQTTYACTLCPYSYQDNYHPATGLHNYVDGACTVCGGLRTSGLSFTLNGNVYRLTGYEGNADVVYVPALYDGKYVTAIGGGAFWQCSTIDTLYIPDRVTTIGEIALRDCSSLTAIHYGGTIAQWQAITKGENWDYGTPEYIVYCTDGALDRAGNKLGAHTHNYASAWSYDSTSHWHACTGEGDCDEPQGDLAAHTYDDVVTPPTCTEQGYTTHTCTVCGYNYVDNYVDATGHTYGEDIGTTAYYTCSVCGQISNGRKAGYEIEQAEMDYSFTLLEGGTYSITIDRYYGSATAVSVPAAFGEYAVTAIGEHAFASANSSHIRSIVLPASVTTIGDEAFSVCSSLDTITIPASVSTIGDMAFAGCSSLAYIHYGGTIAQWRAIAKGENWDYVTSDYTVRCSDGDLAKDGHQHSYTDDVCTVCGELRTKGLTFNLLDNDTYSVSGYTGSDTDVYIPATYNGKAVTAIGECAFYNNGNTYTNNNGIVEVHIPEGVTTIGDHAFRNCRNLTAISIPEGVTTIGDYAFCDCRGLTSISIPTGVTTIGDHAFAYCIGLTSFEVPSSVTSLGGSAFLACRSLTSFVIPNRVTTIGSRAYSGCDGLTSITIGSGVTSIGSYSFDGCSVLAGIYFDSSMAQWQTIPKGTDWDNGTPNYTVHCLDGDLAKDGHQHTYVDDVCSSCGVELGDMERARSWVMRTNAYLSEDEKTNGVCADTVELTARLRAAGIEPLAPDGTGYATYWYVEGNRMILYSAVQREVDVLSPYGDTWVEANRPVNYLTATKDPQGNPIHIYLINTYTTSVVTSYWANSPTATAGYTVAQLQQDGATPDMVKTGLNEVSVAFYTPELRTSLDLTTASTLYINGYTLVQYEVNGSYALLLRMALHGEAWDNTENLFYIYTKPAPSATADDLAALSKQAGLYVYQLFGQINAGLVSPISGIVLQPGLSVDCSGCEWAPVRSFGGFFGSCNAANPAVISGVTLTAATSYRDTVVFDGSNGKYFVTGFIGTVYGNCIVENVRFEQVNIDEPGGDFNMNMTTRAVSRNNVGIIGAVVDGGYDSTGAFYQVPANVLLRGILVTSTCNITSCATAGGLVGYVGGCGTNNALYSGTLLIEGCDISANVRGNLAMSGNTGYGPNGGIIGFVCRAVETGTGTSVLAHDSDSDPRELYNVVIKDCIFDGKVDGYKDIGAAVGNIISGNVVLVGTNNFAQARLNTLGLSGSLDATNNNVVGSVCGSIGDVTYGNLIFVDQAYVVAGLPVYKGSDTQTSKITVTPKYDIVVDGVTIATGVGCNNGTNHDHVYSDAVTPPTCTEQGYTTHTCTVCGYLYTDTYVAATGHSYNSAVTPPTCTEQGYTTHTCSMCGHSYVDTYVAATGHNYVDGVCTGCGEHEPSAGLVYTLLGNGTYCVTDYTGTDTAVYIPAAYNGKAVTEIGYEAFRSCKNLTSISMPATVTTIGNYAFAYCSGLASISIPADVTFIGDYAFSGCSGLTSITIPDRVASIGAWAFAYCSGLTSITIPASVTSIGGGSAFAYCSGLTSVTVVDGNFVYHSVANCIIETETKTLVLGCKNSVIPTDGSVTSVGASALRGSSGMASISIPSCVTNIGNYAFAYCSGLADIYYDGTMAQWNDITKGTSWNYETPDYTVHCSDGDLDKNGGTVGLQYTLLDGGTYSVSGYTGTDTAVYIPATYNGKAVTEIGARAFRSCKNLTSIIMPATVTTIGDSAFSDCSGLTAITIPEGMTEIGNSAFWCCSGLTSITVADGNIKYHSAGNCLIETASKTVVLGCKNSVIPADGSVTTIEDLAFGVCSGLTSITIPDSVTSIGNNAFNDCSGLTAITIGSGVTAIGNQAFIYCSGLTSITIPDRVASIGSWAFAYCSGLTSITIPDSVTSIGESVLSGCSGLTSITVAQGNTKYHSAGNCIIETASKTLVAGCKTSVIPTDGSVISIGNYAFSGCSGLTSITIPDSVTSIGNNAFNDCSGLTAITIGSGVTTIGSSVFYNCSNLEEVRYTGDIAGWCAIAGLNNLMQYGTSTKTLYIDGSKVEGSLTIPSGVTTIPSSAFYGCSGLTSISILDGVTSIGDYAFYKCSGLTSIAIPDSVTSIGGRAFYGCSGLADIYYGGTMEQWAAIEKGQDWDKNTPDYIVHCSDGNVDKSGNTVE